MALFYQDDGRARLFLGHYRGVGRVRPLSLLGFVRILIVMRVGVPTNSSPFFFGKDWVSVHGFFGWVLNYS